MPVESDFLLVIPAYEEHQRLPSFLKELIEALADAPFTTSVQIVDNGSSAVARSRLAQAVTAIAGRGLVEIRPILAQAEKGKGSAIRRGWGVDSTAPWLAFVDADGAVSAGEVRRLLTLVHASRHDEPLDSIIAIRTQRAGQVVRRRWPRDAASRVFAMGTTMLFGARFRDTQCGCKIVSRTAWNKIAASCMETGFLFDLELLLRLKQGGATIREVEIDWVEKSDGHFYLVPDGLKILVQAVRLRIALSVQRWKKTVA